MSTFVQKHFQNRKRLETVNGDLYRIIYDQHKIQKRSNTDVKQLILPTHKFSN